jgi:hypothetical protein
MWRNALPVGRPTRLSRTLRALERLRTRRLLAGCPSWPAEVRLRLTARIQGRLSPVPIAAGKPASYHANAHRRGRLRIAADVVNGVC